ncbi:MAG: hypothetical protein JWO94_2511, partial [Verrucomicrobiaceae bacterium]|nr:hypothetical protein [Verrucomicrobiaceae bacterium]
AGFYHFESGSDPSHWSTAQGVVETVVSTATINGTDVENVEAVVPTPAANAGFVRLVTTAP